MHGARQSPRDGMKVAQDAKSWVGLVEQEPLIWTALTAHTTLPTHRESEDDLDKPLSRDVP